jgi:DNA-binding Lrp family transcriptional regulator
MKKNKRDFLINNKKRLTNNSNGLIVDGLDLKLIDLILQGHTNNKELAQRVNTPLSTIERRTRLLFRKEILDRTPDLNYQKLGAKRAFISIKINGSNIHSVAQDISKIRGILSVSLTVGNFDLIGIVVYNNSEELLDIISAIKSSRGVKSTEWSEEIYKISRNNYPIPTLVRIAKKQ